MHLRTIAFLLALLALFGGLWLWQRRASVPQTATREHALVEGLDLDRLRALRIDHRERTVQLRFERDENGLWFLVDPIAYPAEEGMLQPLVELLANARGEEVAQADPRKLGLDPPRALIECIEARAEGERRTSVLVGALDVDGSSVHVLAGGRVLRAPRALSELLDLPPDEFRRRRLVELDPSELVGIRRHTAVLGPIDAGSAPLSASAGSFEARREPLYGAPWELAQPLNAPLDAAAMAVLARSAAHLRALRFVGESEAEAQALGMDEPEFELELHGADGGSRRLSFARARDDRGLPRAQARWLCRASPLTQTFELAALDVELVSVPLDQLLERRLVRGPRAGWTRIRIEGPGGRIELVRGAPNLWSVSTVDAADAAAGAPRAAQASKVEELLGRLEHARFAAFPAGALERFEAAPAQERALIELGDAQGRVERFELGPVFETSGARGRLLRRDDEALVGLVDAALESAFALGAQELRSLALIELKEIEAHAIELRQGERVRRYERDGRGRWTPAGVELEAKALLPLVDGLLHLRAQRWLAPPAGEAPAALEEPIELVVTDTRGRAQRATIGLGLGGRVEAEIEGERAQLRDELYAQLLELLR